MDPKLQAAVDQWLEWDKNEDTRTEINKLVQEKYYDELTSLLLSGRLAFGTAGLRSRMGAGFTCMNQLTVLQTAQGLAAYVKKQQEKDEELRVVIGYDGRYNSKSFAEISANVFLRAGFKVYLYSEMVPTPYVAFALRHYKAHCAVMVTASHNPKPDNGYKVYWKNGAQILPPHDGGIAQAIEENLVPQEGSWDYAQSVDAESSTFVQKGLLVDPFAEVFEAFNQSLTNAVHFKEEIKANSGNMKVIYTAMHGVGTKFVERALVKDLQFPANSFVKVEQQCFPDPDFSTVEFPNPEEGKTSLDLAVRTGNNEKGTLILANDPDADRLAIAERLPNGKDGWKWRLFTGNQLGALFGWWALQRFKIEHAEKVKAGLIKSEEEKDAGNALKKCLMVSSNVSSTILKSMAKKEGFQFKETLTGFKWMGTAGQQAQDDPVNPLKVLFAFEESIGYMWGDRVFDKDGVTACCMLVELAAYVQARYSGRTLSEQLDEIYKQYGYHETSNSYVLSYDPHRTKMMFDEIRTPNYPTEIGDAKVLSVRDLTMNYDSSTPDKKPLLPQDVNQNITFELDNGIRFTLRTSGTEPKIKWYSEMITSRRQPRGALADFVDEAIVDGLIRPSEFAFSLRPVVPVTPLTPHQE